jgi:hypothetical protein
MVYLRGPTVVLYIIRISARCRPHACFLQRLVHSLDGHVTLRGKAQRPIPHLLATVRVLERSRPGSDSYSEMARIVYCALLVLSDHKVL